MPPINAVSPRITAILPKKNVIPYLRLLTFVEMQARESICLCVSFSVTVGEGHGGLEEPRGLCVCVCVCTHIHACVSIGVFV